MRRITNQNVQPTPALSVKEKHQQEASANTREKEAPVKNSRNAVASSEVPAASGPYSAAIMSRGFSFLSGQGPYDSAGVLSGEDIETQTRQTLRNLDAVARASGASLKDAVRIGVYLTDMVHFAAMNLVFEEFFEHPFPARTTVMTGLPKPEMLIEIDAIVAVPNTI